MADKQYKDMNEVLEDAEEAIQRSTPPVVEEHNRMREDMSGLVYRMKTLEDEINMFMQKWIGQFNQTDLINLRTSLQQNMDQLKI